MSRSRGRRYDKEPKLNIKKVIAVILAIVVIVMFVIIIKNIVTSDGDNARISSLSYFVSFENDKWGVIDSNGNNVINPSYEEMIIIPNSKKDVFLVTYDVDYNAGTYSTKALNSKNEEIFTEYNQIEAIQNKDDSNNLWYEQNVLKVQKDNKYGLINLDGKVLQEPQYDEITAVSGIENAFKVKKDNLYGIVDNEGKMILQPEYADIINLGDDNLSGYIIKNQEQKYGIVDYTASQVLEAKYDSIENVYGNDLYVVTENGVKKVINKDGSDVLTQGFDSVKEILSNKDNGIIFERAGKYGVMKLDGTVTIEPNYEDLDESKSGFLIAKLNGKYGIIDLQQTEKIPYNYNSIEYNQSADIYIADDENYNTTLYNSNFEAKVQGMLLELNKDQGYIKMSIGEDIKYYNFRFEEKTDKDIFPANTLNMDKKDGKYGFVNKNGEVVVDYIYDDATEQNGSGYAGIKKDGKWGNIDSTGKIVQEPIYNLDDYLLVDFIGNWHLGKDINANYYNKE